jgi:hypothetical protein
MSYYICMRMYVFFTSDLSTACCAAAAAAVVVVCYGKQLFIFYFISVRYEMSSGL